jgi:hypothetical protein
LSISEDEQFFDVKYVLDNTTEKKVNINFIISQNELSRDSRRSRKRVADISIQPNIEKTSSFQESSFNTINTKILTKKNNNNDDKSVFILRNNENVDFDENNKENIIPKNQLCINKLTSTNLNNLHSKSMKSKNKICILTTAVNTSLSSKLSLFASKFKNVEIADQFDEDEVTHLLVTLEKNGVMKQRTMKYMKSLMSFFFFF